MREIDKLVSRAYPDELRRVTPIPVDEKAILARTLGKLNLTEAASSTWKKGRYVGRHSKKPEPQLVEMPREPRQRRWTTWLGWAVAACLLLVAAVNFGPYMLQGMGLGTAPAAQGEDRDYVRLLQNNQDEAAPKTARKDADAAVNEPEQTTAEELKKTAQISEKAKEAAGGAVAQGVETASLQAFQINGNMSGDLYGGVQVTGVTMELDPVREGFEQSAQYTFAVSFPGYNAYSISLFEFTLTPDNLDSYWEIYQTSRENKEGMAYVTFRVGGIDANSPGSILGTLQIMNPTYSFADENSWYGNIFMYTVDLSQQGGECFAYEFTDEDYISYGYYPPVYGAGSAAVDGEPADASTSENESYADGDSMNMYPTDKGDADDGE